MQGVNIENIKDLKFSSENIDRLKEIYKFPDSGFNTIIDSIDKLFCCYIEVCINSGENITIDGIDVQYFRDIKIVLEVLQQTFESSTLKN
ncbi:hypothetical protein SAMN05421796_11058 [Chryseobacterium piscicola]|uniref:Uncharacterized protein n=2 Tax=Chryseobacterium TaxID=59732 RepID=A0A1N7P132_9FLAO|nr:hypothetical protein [Chryseobacterium piscicola]PQA92758.1 hypothetical protein B0A70_10255 [Chryseobacterium piscicola]REC50806.1 hypothetical protein DRF62_18605 [Chryseobacterium piscium]SIT04271.1 hypothetical protein SAMN05421796_11058 [Chryseobacterium piscicola]